MSFGRDLKLGLSYGKAFNFIFKHNLWYYYFFPLVIWGLLLWGSIYMGETVGEWTRDWLNGLVGSGDVDPTEDLPWYKDVWYFITDGAAYLSKWIVGLVVASMFGILSKYITLILLSPILAFLSEKVEKIVTGNDYPFEWDQFMRDIWRGVLIALRNMVIEYGIAIPCFIITLIFPPLYIVVKPFQWTLGWYFYGFAMLDYANERRRLSVGESVRFVRKHKGVAIGNGWLFAVFMWIPIIGIMLAPITACVAATLSVHDLVDLNTNPHAHRDGGTPPAENAGTVVNSPPPPPLPPTSSTPPTKEQE